MFFKISLYIALAVFGLGLLYRIFSWLSRSINQGDTESSLVKRLVGALKGIASVIFSAKIITLFKVFLLDVILQRKILKEDLLRWIMHMCIYGGFMMLLFMHALDKFISINIFSGYYSTLNPYMFLRDLFGLMAIAGILIAIYRRFILKVPRLRTNAMDLYAIILIIVIMISGVLLEGLKITSFSDYKRMVDGFGAAGDEKEAKALEAYWVKEYSVVSPDASLKFDAETLTLGKEVHNRSCNECHSKPSWAFMGYAASAVIKPAARGIDEANGVQVLLYIHFLAVFLGLAYLPFSKMFHMITTPLSLLANAVMEEGKSDPMNISTRQMMELEACTHCSTCSLRCSALGAYEMIGNRNILPSEKLIHIKALAGGKKLNDEELRSLQEGIYICTNCDRCTVVCPSGINLKDLWFKVREELIHRGYPVPQVLSPLSFFRGLMKNRLEKEYYLKPLKDAKEKLTAKLAGTKGNGPLSLKNLDKKFIEEMGMPGDAGTYSYCFSCSTCTSSCPVVSSYEKPMETLGLVPHQIMHSAALGLKDVAIGSGMLWDCLTCYKCQENCPQGVRVAEVIYKLKNLAAGEEKGSINRQEAREV